MRVDEQDYSLNPGRYVGVVIEEDGKTEEEFTAEILALNAELQKLNGEARELEAVIDAQHKATDSRGMKPEQTLVNVILLYDNNPVGYLWI